MGALSKGCSFLPLFRAHCSAPIHPLFPFATASLPQPCKPSNRDTASAQPGVSAAPCSTMSMAAAAKSRWRRLLPVFT